MFAYLPRYFLPMLCVLLLGGCGATAPVMNIDSAPIKTSSSTSNLSDIRGALSAALGNKGWKIKDAGQHSMTATRQKDGKIATVRAAFSQQSYSITYIDSSNLGYDGSNINAEYNDWLADLDLEIKHQLNRL